MVSAGDLEIKGAASVLKELSVWERFEEDRDGKIMQVLCVKSSEGGTPEALAV